MYTGFAPVRSTYNCTKSVCAIFLDANRLEFVIQEIEHTFWHQFTHNDVGHSSRNCYLNDVFNIRFVTLTGADAAVVELHCLFTL